MQRLARLPNCLALVPLLALAVTAVGNIASSVFVRPVPLPDIVPAVPIEPTDVEDFVIPIASNDSEAIIKLQGQSVQAPDGKSYRILGITDAPTTGCQVTLMDYGKKVPCSEVLGWGSGQSPQSPQVTPSPDR